jgi:hypothetical protein
MSGWSRKVALCSDYLVLVRQGLGRHQPLELVDMLDHRAGVLDARDVGARTQLLPVATTDGIAGFRPFDTIPRWASTRRTPASPTRTENMSKRSPSPPS